MECLAGPARCCIKPFGYGNDWSWKRASLYILIPIAHLAEAHYDHYIETFSARARDMLAYTVAIQFSFGVYMVSRHSAESNP